ncbi:hypothetical protein AHAS_Ahas19G0382400 [Arachis hypogaea]
MLLNEAEDDAVIVHDLNRPLLTNAILKKRLYFSAPRTENEEPRLRFKVFSNTTLGWMRFIVSHIRGVPQQLMVPVLLNQVEDDAFIVHDLNRRLLTDAILKKRLYFSAPRSENEEPRLRFKVFSNTTVGWMRFIVSHIRGVPQQLMVPVLLNEVEGDAFIVHDLNRQSLTDVILKKRLYFSVRLKLKFPCIVLLRAYVIYTFSTEIEAIWLHGPRTRNRVSVSKSSQTPPLGGCALSFLTYVGFLSSLWYWCC